TGLLALKDASNVTSLNANASGPGAWSANFKIGVIAGLTTGTYRIVVTDSDDSIVEESSDLASQQAAVMWSVYSAYIRITLGTSAENPAVISPAAMRAGDDDRSNITDDEWATALGAFSKGLGPGQVLAPGRTTDTGHSQLLDHAATTNRAAILDLPDSSTAATLIASADAARTGNQRYGASFAPWIIIPGVAGTIRVVPMSAAVAGLIARNDPSLGTNRASAGNAGLLRTSTDLSQPSWDDTTRENLNANSVNVVRRLFNGFRVYGFRSLTDGLSDPNWVAFSNVRFIMFLRAELDEVGENYVFLEIDGQNGATINAFHADLGDVLIRHYNNGELFGNTPEEAFAIDTGPTVNTLQTIADGQLKAVVQVKVSPFAE